MFSCFCPTLGRANTRLCHKSVCLSVVCCCLLSSAFSQFKEGGCKKLSFSFLWTKTELVSCTCVLTIEKGTQDTSSVLDRQEGCKKDFLPSCYPLLAKSGIIRRPLWPRPHMRSRVSQGAATFTARPPADERRVCGGSDFRA